MSEPKTDGGTPYPEKVPVVEYYKIAAYLYRVVDGKCDEVVEPAKSGIYPQIPWKFIKGCHILQITHHEYESAKEAAKQPAPAEKVRMIEPLGNYPDMKLMRDKMNEIVEWSREVTAWINAEHQARVLPSPECSGSALNGGTK